MSTPQANDTRTTACPTMHPAYRVWWRFLMDLRPMVRFFAERFPKAGPLMIRLRSVLHWLVGNPIQTVAAVLGIVLWGESIVSGRRLLVALVVVHLVVEIYCRIRFDRGNWLVGWRAAWRIRRRWPSDWAAVAAKTSRVQAEVGTSKEPIASAVLRPVADHPKLSWRPRLEWPVVSWWVGPPPGRSLASLDELTVVLAANISHVADVAVDYERENDSHGRLIVSFRDVLERTSSPPWQSPGPNDVVTLGAPVDGDDLGSAIADFDRDTPAGYPPLRVVEEEAS